MDLRYPPAGPAREFGRTTRIVGICAAVSGFVLGFGALAITKVPPVYAALITTFDFMIGMWLYWSGSRQQKREEAAKLLTLQHNEFKR